MGIYDKDALSLISEPHIDFVAIDFETATKSQSSACSVGLAFVKNLNVIASFHYLIQPPGNQYDQDNIAIHGIYPEDTENAPDFLSVWEKIYPMIQGKALIAHNAYFDMSVIKASLAQSAFYCPDEYTQFKYVDTISMVKEFVPGKKSLDACTAKLGIELTHHHNAEQDAVACAKIAIHCIKESNCLTLGEFCFSRPHIHIHELKDVSDSVDSMIHRSKSRKVPEYSTICPKDIRPCVAEFNEDHPLYKKSIVFTGELSIDRKDAMQMAVDVGAAVKSGVSRKTDYLIVGKQDNTLVGDDGMSSKEEKAYALIAEGKANIQIITEDEFLRLLQGEGACV